ncbi:glycosyltransferase family 39 protein [Actinospica durhamensis]|uniref:Glycosyltransferase family 39 protein n=1 Tax=Actinospica durhamensis TaxID=1508375 RepID=A0A941EV08_9ACTN|nr:glycosyltransferase family 39 protein [Actinospica durhamensis]MBR7838820.1 glycosyltransferase family 39 protein [Actinospica durhamensis]
MTTTTSTVPGAGPDPDTEAGDRPAAGALARRWRAVALLALCALTAALYAWNLSAAGYPPFYSMAVRSMSMSWKAMLFGSLDPRSTLTMDKLAGSFVPQALSARVFGFHAWALALPQMLEGVAAALVFHSAVRRWTGSRDAALLGMLLLAFTPVVASMFEHSMEDGALTLCLVLAADRYQYAVTRGRLRSLVFAGVWVGVGFQAKMLEAWVIVPALAVGYLATAPLPGLRRVAHTAIAGLVMVLTSLSWILLYTLTPASDRPYIDGTSNDNAFSMVFGYNGLSRLGIHVPGALGTASGANLHAALRQLGVSSAPAPAQTQSFGADGWGKLFGAEFAPEIGWLYPLALIALGAGLWFTRRAARTDAVRGGFVFWGLWFVTGILVLSAMAVPHTAYLALLAPPICALSAAGLALYWRTWLLPVAVLAEALWTAYLARQYANFLPWLTPVVIALAVLSLVLVVIAALRHSTAPSGGPMRLAAILGAAAMLVTPLAWAAATLDPAYGGNALDAIAGPVRFGFTAGGGAPTARQAAPAPSGASSLTQDTQLDTAQWELLAYVDAHAHTAYALATDNWLTAQPYIDGAGAAVLPMGGFSGMAPAPTLARLQADVREKRLAYVLLDLPGTFNMGFLFGNVGGGPTVKAVDAWVRRACRAVPSSDYGGPAGSVSQVLYDCAAPRHTET